jgi:2-polyprenyl-6-methoxyphenol hydroxylase-like FAD-dependent oxidoreductase
MTTTKPSIAIIGSGLSGLALALALHQQGIPCTVYESRPAPLNIGGAVMLSPNALRVLDNLGVYDSVKTKGYNFEDLHFRDFEGKLLETYEFGSAEKYGYPALRIYRHVLIDALLDALRQAEVPIQFGRKISHVMRESDPVSDNSSSDAGPRGSVTFAFTDGTTETASVLVGADGIHSTVRRYLYPDLTPQFINMAGVTAAVPTAQLNLPADYHIPVTITDPKHGAFVIAPQEPDGSEVLIGKQRRIETNDFDRAGWDRIHADKAASVAFLQSNTEAFPEIVRNAVSHIQTDKINVWPFYVVPRLERWSSAARRVVILGDSAHAIPPSAGQGINQAFEDAYVLALVVGKVAAARRAGNDAVRVEDALGFWQTYRQGRVDRVLELNQQIDLRRLPEGDERLKGVKREEFDLAWLYVPDFKKDVDEWFAKQLGN